MSEVQALREAVIVRLAAAAEDIFAVVGKAIAGYEDELRRSREENRRKQRLLNSVLKPRVVLPTVDIPIPSLCPSPGLTQDVPETPQVKEEPDVWSVGQKEEPLPMSVPESSAVCVKNKESSSIQQGQSEHREETQGEDISPDSETEGDTELSSDADCEDDWTRPISCAPAHVETGSPRERLSPRYRSRYGRVQSRRRSTRLCPQNKSAPNTTVHNGDTSGAEGGAERKHQCSVCFKGFLNTSDLKRHSTVHTGEKPFNCSFCHKAFSRKDNLDSHVRIHTGQKPFKCPAAPKPTVHNPKPTVHKSQKSGAEEGRGERKFQCSLCHKTFMFKKDLNRHYVVHTGEKPFSCSICKKAFTRKDNLDVHIRKRHTDKLCLT